MVGSISILFRVATLSHNLSGICHICVKKKEQSIFEKLIKNPADIQVISKKQIINSLIFCIDR